jgi:transposase
MSSGSDTLYLGLDISKGNFDAALLDPSSTNGTQGKPRHKAFPNTPAGFERLQEWLGSTTVYACLEATGTYGDAQAAADRVRCAQVRYSL